jgi:hypothetical protein
LSEAAGEVATVKVLMLLEATEVLLYLAEAEAAERQMALAMEAPVEQVIKEVEAAEEAQTLELPVVAGHPL